VRGALGAKSLWRIDGLQPQVGAYRVIFGEPKLDGLSQTLTASERLFSDSGRPAASVMAANLDIECAKGGKAARKIK